jgi:nucleotide-binding universal stress UspA family protein
MSAFPKQILVHLDAGGAASARLGLASQLARQHEAALSALYATVPVFLGLPSWPEVAPSLAASLIEIDDERRQRTHRMFDQAIAAGAVGATWSETPEVAVVGAFVQQALYADLLVLGQHDPGDVQAAGVPADFVEAVVVASGKPAIVVPHVGCPERVGDTVAIAWKPTREAARAVSAAIPLFQKPWVVLVETWDPGKVPGDAPVQGAALDLEGYLRLHRIRATWHRGGPEPEALGEILLSRVFYLGADLLVMGCYGHTRAREWMLGGASRSILASMTLPVLMAH